MRFDLVTIFPEFFGAPPTPEAPGHGLFGFGVVSRAFREGTAQLGVHDLRSFTHDRHRTVDDRPFGGGEGMVLKPGPLAECLESLGVAAKAGRDPARERVILLSAQGRRFTQAVARELAQIERVVLVCGRYEGVDERVAELLCDDELGIGDYVLSGGELGAAVIVDAVTRLLPGVLGHADSSRFESFGEGDAGEHKTGDGVPRSTRPAEFRGLEVPAPLQNGDHLAIRRWRRQAALAKTLRNRPDLLEEAELSDEDREFLAGLGWTA
jgi:tRNA (guanine37-N1)-methyltransferase